MNDFDYLKDGEVYLDAACQSLRPRPVINALNEYYEKFNSCGERVKYPWGIETDRRVEATREKVLKYLKLSKREYFVSFTLNTTYGINLILSQLDGNKFNVVVTSDIEHNSPFLSTMSFAKKWGLERKVLSRGEDGSLSLEEIPERAVVVVNVASNIDGRKLVNIKDVVKKVHKSGGVIIIDAAQAMAHSADVLHKTEADAICFSAHKLYAPSLGGIIYQSYFASLSVAEAKLELKSWLREFGATEEEIAEISTLEKSDEVKTILEKVKDIAENQVHIKGIPTLLYNHQKHLGLYEE